MMTKHKLVFVKYFIELNEKFIFGRKLKKFYRKYFSDNLNYVIDVGVNTGQTISIVQSINNDCIIYGFEPNPKLFDLLKTKYSNSKTINIEQTGISNVVGKKTFYENILHSTSTFEEYNDNSEYLKKKANILGVKKENLIANQYKVNVTTLSDFISKNQITHIDLIKIDTEGHEYQCLEGLFSNKLVCEINYIQIEEHDDDMYANKLPFSSIEKLLNTNGFYAFHKIKHGFGNFYEVIFKRK